MTAAATPTQTQVYLQHWQQAYRCSGEMVTFQVAYSEILLWIYHCSGNSGDGADCLRLFERALEVVSCLKTVNHSVSSLQGIAALRAPGRARAGEQQGRRRPGTAMEGGGRRHADRGSHQVAVPVPLDPQHPHILSTGRPAASLAGEAHALNLTSIPLLPTISSRRHSRQSHAALRRTQMQLHLQLYL